MLIFPSGYWTDTRMRISSNANLHAVGMAVGLDSCIHVNPTNPVAISQKIMANTVEAVIGAVFSDGGLAAARLSMQVLGLVYTALGTNMVMTNYIPLHSYQTLRINLPFSLVLDMSDLGKLAIRLRFLGLHQSKSAASVKAGA
jgi:hypothetical protein